MDKIRAAMKDVKAPTEHHIVYKDECMFSFDTPYSPGGLAVNLSSWTGFGERYVGLDHERTGNTLYLLQKWKTIPKTKEEEEVELADIEKAAAEGKILLPNTQKKVEKAHWLLLMPERTEVPYIDGGGDLPMAVAQACEGVIKHAGSRVQDGIAAIAEDDEVKESKYAADLEQLPTEGKKIPSDPKLWKCDETGVTENLWLNLSTGFIGSGRKQWDGSGGNGAAERHFEATGKKYPLVVKLGTITPNGADLYSYAPDENNTVTDAKLADHLAHWGIDVMKLEKTEKTIAELQATLNLEHDFSKITEAGEDLELLSGPGLVGIANLGNTCYINSVVQCLFTMPEVLAKYADGCDALFKSAPDNVATDFTTQMAKLGAGLSSDRYAEKPGEEGPDDGYDVCVRPRLFKSLVGRNHSEFSTSRQQDAAEYLLHLLDFATREERKAKGRLPDGPTTASLFASSVEERIECLATHQVRYKSNGGNFLNLMIPLEQAENNKEYKEFQDKKRAKLVEDDAASVVAKVPFAACLGRFFDDEVIADFKSPATGEKGLAKKTTRFQTFPRYLVVKINRYYTDPATWEPKKMEVEVPVPEELDLEAYRGKGLQEGEVELPEDAPDAAAAAPEIDMAMVEQLMGMGFGENGCKRAVQAMGKNGVEAATEWVFNHMGDPDFNDPLPDPAAVAGGGKAEASPELIANLTMLGFTEQQAKAALLSTDNNTERAAEWLFSRADSLDAAVAEALAEAEGAAADAAGAAAAGPDDGPGKYTLFGIVSHLGKNTGSGHYVAHVKKDGKWVIFNDRKVGLSKCPPLDVGYMYFFQRNE